jgi:hypothetical protein
MSRADRNPWLAKMLDLKSEVKTRDTRPLASLDGFSRSHGDGLYVMQLVVAATNQNALYTSRLRANKDIFSV